MGFVEDPDDTVGAEVPLSGSAATDGRRTASSRRTPRGPRR